MTSSIRSLSFSKPCPSVGTSRASVLARPRPAVSMKLLARRRVVCSASAVALDWEGLEAVAQKSRGTWSLRPDQVPSTAPEPSLPTSPSSDTAKRVLLYRDTNSWCPFCERVLCALVEKGIDFETVFIDLRSKPDWYLEMVPTALVPSIKLDGQVFFESKDILAALEEAFPEPPLLPSDPALCQQAQELIDAADDLGGSGYKFMRGKSMTAKDDEPAVPVEDLKAEFEAQLAKMEEALGRTDGPFFLSEFSLVDITYIPSMQRLASQLGHFRGFHLRGSETFPRVSAWLEALNHRESFNAVKTDDGTLLQIFLKLFGMEEPEKPVPTPAALEAGHKLASNHDAVLKDIMKNAGLMQAESEMVQQAAEVTVFNLAAELNGQPHTALPGEEEAKAAKAVSAAVLAFLRSRVSSPRDMSSSAAVAFRAAADRLLSRVYW